MDSAASQKTKKPAAEKVLLTAGEILSDGILIDLVATGSAAVNDLALLLWDGKKLKIAPQIEYRGICYKPVQLHKTIRRAVRLPSRAANYGSTWQLLGEIAGLFCQDIGLPAPESALAAAWAGSTWLADVIWSLPPLVITGADMNLAVRALQLLHCVCRRPLLLADVSRSTTRTLPMQLRPTLLLNQPELSPKIRAAWQASNYRGVFVPGNGGALMDIACPKAVFLSLEGRVDALFNSPLQLTLPPVCELPPPDARELDETANRMQPRLLRFRLDHFRNLSEPRPSSSQLNLPACIENDPDFVRVVGPLLERQKQENLAGFARDVNAALVEVLWGASHRTKEIAVADLTALTNSALRDRGEILAYSAEEIGRRLSSLGLDRDRAASGMVLRFSREHSLRIHRFARQLGLNLSPVAGCRDCAPPEQATTQ